MNHSSSNHYIRKVHSLRNISRAAMELGLSQPALSMSIAQTERSLGFKIFDRSTTPLSLTDAGKIYIDYLEKQSIIETEMKRKLSDLENATQKTINIGAPNVYISSIIAPKIHMISEKHPDLTIQVQSAPLPRLIEASETSAIDFFISTTDTSEQDHITIPIKQETIYLCIPRILLSPEDTSSANVSILIKKGILSDIPYIALQDNQPLQIAFNKVNEKYQLNMKSAITVEQVTSALSIASFGGGYCLATSESFGNLHNLNDLCIYDFSEYIPPRTIYAAYHKNRYVSNITIEIIEILKEDYENDQKTT